MARRQAQLKVLISCIAVVIIVALGYVLSTSNARALPRTTFLSPMQQLTPRAWLPVVMNNFPPPATISRYITSTEYSLLYNLGCNRSQAISSGQNATIILDFGQPAYQNGQYGTLLFDAAHSFRSTDQIKNGTFGFLGGFYTCRGTTPVSLTLAVGTSNYGNGVTREHGVAWAQMVNNINTWVTSPPSYADKIAAVWAGIDAEPSWNSPAVTRAWVDGYAATSTGQSLYANFGSCDGCPFSGCPACVPNNNWSRDDIWYVSWGATPAFPLPEIYLTNGVNADQWYRMSLYAYTNHGYRMNFVGSLTQWNACQEVGGCAGTDNRPEAGYLQLYNAVNADSRTAQTIRWSTDISWQK